MMEKNGKMAEYSAPTTTAPVTIIVSTITRNMKSKRGIKRKHIRVSLSLFVRVMI